MTSDQLRDPRGVTGVPGFQFEPHHCFACGELNEQGLRLVLHVTADGCWTETTLAPRFQGWESVAHGGIVTTLLDEVMAWSVIGRGTWGVTARISVAFRRPVPVGRPIRAEGVVVEDRRRTIRTSGRVLDAGTGEILAEGEGTFVAAPPEQLAQLKARYRLRPVADEAGVAAPTVAVRDTTDSVAGAATAGPATER
ncbi:MAG TPA: PaaI family thioesterase [Candidatus Limnocylindrales bacterium]|nr:PaaI family thioesterase [Candidatus Limnocylindrales bacterium]